MFTMVFALPKGSGIDWVAAASEIRGVPLERLWDTGDLYPWEGWLEEAENLPGAKPAFVALRAAQADLHAHAMLLRAELEAVPRRIIRFELPAHVGWVVGGPSAGDSPDDIVGPVRELADAGVLRAAGVTSWTDYGYGDFDDRHFGFGLEDERRTRVGIAGAHVAERAATLARLPVRAPIAERLDTCTTLLRKAVDGRMLIEAASQLLLLTTWLLGPGEDGFGARLEDTMLDAVFCWDDDDYDDVLINVPVLRSHREVAHEAMRRLGALRDTFDEIAEWQLGGDCDYEVPVDEELAASLKIEPLAAMLGGLADLHGAAICDLLDWPPRPVPPLGERAHVRVGGGLLVLGVAELDWDNLRSRIDPAQTLYDRLVADLHELRQVLAGRGYPRYSTVEEVGNHRVLVAAPTFELEWPDVGLGVLRLRLAGVLQGDGIVWFDADGYHEDDAYPAPRRRRVLAAAAPEATVSQQLDDPEATVSRQLDDPWGDIEELALLGSLPEEELHAEGPLPSYDYCNGDPLDCIEDPRGCGGDVALRHPGQGEWRWPRCEIHGARRVEPASQ